jgi:uridylate kinase
MENKLPIRICNMFEGGALIKIINGENVGTLIY